MRLHITFFCFFFAWGVMIYSPVLHAEQQNRSTIDPEADKVLMQMNNYMNSLQQFTVHIENSRDLLLHSGHKIQMGASANVFVRRPDRFRCDRTGDDNNQQFFYDGKKFTLYGKTAGSYATIEVPPSLEDTLDIARESFGIIAPAADFIYRDSYDIFIENIKFGDYIGLHKVNGIECHHLLFSQTEVDWQIWIENGKTPLPKKLVITEKLMAGGPQFTVLFSDWDLTPQLQDNLFSFEPPETARQIEFLPIDKTPVNIK